jgi:hypothetical protein
MQALRDVGGWVKLPPRLLFTPVWSGLSAWRVFCWLLLTAGHRDRRVIVTGQTLDLLRGQAACHLADIEAATGLSRKAVRCALDALQRESAVTSIPVPGCKMTIFEIGDYDLYQGDGRGDDGGDTNPGPVRAHVEGRTWGQFPISDNPRDDREIPVGASLGGVTCRDENGRQTGPLPGPAINNEEEIKKIRNHPPTP